jgi:hypothetical protein
MDPLPKMFDAPTQKRVDKNLNFSYAPTMVSGQTLEKPKNDSQSESSKTQRYNRPLNSSLNVFFGAKNEPRNPQKEKKN